MRVVIITVAGISNRFNEGIPAEEHVLKAIYYEKDSRNSLLYQLLCKIKNVDKIVIVGGYKYDDLIRYIESEVESDIRSKIVTIYNEHYSDWASGYSLFLGIDKAFTENPNEVIFIEGDLDLDADTITEIENSSKSILTYNREVIRSNKAVVVYQDIKGRYKYAFNSSHGHLKIDEPFMTILNSGQVWKFNDIERLRTASRNFIKKKEDGTNLEIVGDYFSNMEPECIEVISFKKWTNCNTRKDYYSILEGWLKAE